MAHILLVFTALIPFWGFAAKPEITTEPLIREGLEAPVFAVASGDALFILDQPGRVLKYAGKKLEVVLDLRSRVDYGGEMGLLGMALHPEFAKKGSVHEGRYFLNFNPTSPSMKTIIREYRIGKKEHVEVLSFSQPYRNHNGGHLAFGPDGYLYVASGDGGAAADPLNAGQDKHRLLGKILRIDVNGKKPYDIPADNPFAKGGGAREVFAWGLRNPWRFSFDPKGRLFAGDVGQDEWEEVDIVEKGKNYGWRFMEGNHCFNPKRNCPKQGLVLPIHEYGRKDGQSITGGYFYRGKKVASLKDTYVYGDYGTGTIWGLKEESSGKWMNRQLLKSGLAISSFGEDKDGEILVVALSGEIHQIVEAK